MEPCDSTREPGPRAVPGPSNPLEFPLTRREQEVLARIGAGRTNRQIAEELTISTATVDRHVQNIFAKLGCTNRTEAARYAFALAADAGAAPTALPPPAPIAPYPGLRAFEAGDAEHYFGRAEEVERLLGHLRREPLAAVIGSSGSGKSSLVRAGLISALSNGTIRGSQDWPVGVMTPGADPVSELAETIATLIDASANTVAHELDNGRTVRELAQSTARSGKSSRLVLVVDQFEELFTMCRDPGRQARFVELLVSENGTAADPVAIVIAVRADFYGECARFPGLATALESAHVLLGPLTPHELRSVIERPAEVAGLALEPGLVHRILSDLGEGAGTLPLLSHALRETWLRRADGTMTIAGYLETGGIQRAIARTADRVFAGLSPREQLLCRSLFVRLTELGSGSDDTRRRVGLAEILNDEETQTDMRRVLQQLAGARLVTVGAETVEVAHEALIREWPRLRTWLDEDRDGHRILRHLTESAQGWDRMARDEGELYRGTRLAAALEWHERARPNLNALEREFLQASQVRHDRELRDAQRRARRLRILATAASALAIIALLVGGFAGLQWRKANDQRDRAQLATGEAQQQRNAADAAVVEATLSRLETEIPLLLKTDRSLAFALAAQAHGLQPGPRTDRLLNVVLGDDPRYLGRIFPSEPNLSGYDLSPDGKYIALRSTSGRYELYDATTRELVTSIQAEPTGVSATVVFLPDGNSILSGTFFDQPNKHFTLVLRDVPALTEINRFEFSLEDPTRSLETVSGRLQSDGRHFFMTIGTRNEATKEIDGVLHIIDVVDWTDQTVATPQPVYGAPLLDPLGRYIVALPAPFASVPLWANIFDATTLALVRSVPTRPNSFVFTPDGSLLVVAGGPAGRLDLWNPDTGELLATTPTTSRDSGLLALDSTGAHVAFASALTQLGIVSLPGLKPVGAPFEGLSRVLKVPKFGPGDERLYDLAVTYALEHWDLSGSGLASAHTESTGPGNVALAPDGSWFVKQSPDGHWSRWRVPGLTLIDRSTSTAGDATLRAPTEPSPAVSADGRYFATAHADCRQPSQVACAGSVVVWDAATGRHAGEPVPVPTMAAINPILLEFHPDLPLLAIAGVENLIIIVSLEDGTPRVRGSFTVENTSNPWVSQLQFLPSAVAPSPTLVVHAGSLSKWDVGQATAVRVWGWNVQATVRGMDVVADGTLALLRASGDLQFFNPESLAGGAEPKPISVIPGVVPPGTTGSILRFSADGQTVAVTNADGKVAVWDVEKKVSIGSSFAWSTAKNALLAPDGKSLLVASDQATILWDLDTALWAEKVCFAAGRNLTEAEWMKYFPGREYEVTCTRWPARPKI